MIFSGFGKTSGSREGDLTGAISGAPVGTGPGRIQNDRLSAESPIGLMRRDFLPQLGPPVTFQKPPGTFRCKLLILRDDLGGCRRSRK